MFGCDTEAARWPPLLHLPVYGMAFARYVSEGGVQGADGPCQDTLHS